MKRICAFTNNEQKPAYHWVSRLNFRDFFGRESDECAAVSPEPASYYNCLVRLTYIHTISTYISAVLQT